MSNFQLLPTICIKCPGICRRGKQLLCYSKRLKCTTISGADLTRDWILAVTGEEWPLVTHFGLEGPTTIDSPKAGVLVILCVTTDGTVALGDTAEIWFTNKTEFEQTELKKSKRHDKNVGSTSKKQGRKIYKAKHQLLQSDWPPLRSPLKA